MGEGRKKGPGGASLNFKVNDYATKELLMAATGKNNEIGIITSTPMTGWYFAAEQPEKMQPGEVWVYTGTSSATAFNALKKNSIMVYPIGAKQMLEDGTLTDVTAKSWQNGEWVDWYSGELYKQGNTYDQYTGGWIAGTPIIMQNGSPYNGKTVPTVQYNSDNVVVSMPDHAYSGCFYVANKRDLTNYTTLYLEGTLNQTGTMCYLGVWTEFGNLQSDNLVASAGGNIDGSAEIDVSQLSGEHRIGFYFYTYDHPVTLTMKELRLK